jgi:hypothetical protein
VWRLANFAALAAALLLVAVLMVLREGERVRRSLSLVIETPAKYRGGVQSSS